MNEKNGKREKMAASGEKLVYPNLKKMNVNPGLRVALLTLIYWL